jgi:hypothetical protein
MCVSRTFKKRPTCAFYPPSFSSVPPAAALLLIPFHNPTIRARNLSNPKSLGGSRGASAIVSSEVIFGIVFKSHGRVVAHFCVAYQRPRIAQQTVYVGCVKIRGAPLPPKLKSQRHGGNAPETRGRITLRGPFDVVRLRFRVASIRSVGRET